MRALTSSGVVLSMLWPSCSPRRNMVWIIAWPLNCFRASTTRSTVNSGELGRSMMRMEGSMAESSFRILLSTRRRASTTLGSKILVELDSTETFACG